MSRWPWSRWLVVCGAAALLSACQLHMAPSLTLQDLETMREQGAAGCGMSLWLPGTDPYRDGIAFFHGMSDQQAHVVVDDRLVRLPRRADAGPLAYGQARQQRFSDGNLTVIVAIDSFTRSGRETVAVTATVAVSRGGASREYVLTGSAGC